MCLILVLVLVLVLVFVVLVLVVGWEGLSGLFRLRAGDGLLVDVLSFSFFAVFFCCLLDFCSINYFMESGSCDTVVR
jgi:hypothetical protein